jgi:hypothetical protein
MVDMEMDAVSGINEARQGTIQGASQLASVTQSSLLQSSLTTAAYFKLFEQFSTNVWNQIARLVKIAWAGKERFAAIIGDSGVNFLKEDIGLDLNDYAVFVQETPRLLDDLTSFHQIVMAGVQSGEVKLADALGLLMEKDVKTGILKFEKITRKREQEKMAQQAAQEQQLLAQQQQGQMAAQQKMAEFNQQTADRAAQTAQQTQQAKNQGAITQTLVKGRIDLQKEKISKLNEKET